MADQIITYLIGAGASYNALPIVTNYISRMKECEKHLLPPVAGDLYSEFRIPEKDKDSNDWHVTSPAGMLKEFCKDINWLCNEVEIEGLKKYATVDTFAKSLYLQDKQDDLRRLKSTLSCFFMLEQLEYEKAKKPGLDIRYNSFWTSLLEKETNRIMLPDRIRILTWNYDYQIEKSYSAVCNEANFISIMERIQYWINDSDFVPDKFCVLHLNGVAGLEKAANGKYQKNDFAIRQSYSKAAILNIIKRYGAYKANSNIPILNFAWEQDSYSQITLKNALSAVQNTNTLVIIGYSFPFFNREIDKKIIGAMTGLNKVYIQSNDTESAQAVMSRLYSFWSKRNIELITNADQFFIPYEY